MWANEGWGKMGFGREDLFVVATRGFSLKKKAYLLQGSKKRRKKETMGDVSWIKGETQRDSNFFAVGGRRGEFIQFCS